MSIDWNSVVKNAESELTRRLVTPIVLKVVSSTASFWFGPLSFLIGLVVGQLVTWGDWVTFYLGDSWMNSTHGDGFQQAGEALANLPKDASKEAIDAAKKAKADAFDKLWGAR